jgi:predicted nucleic acid-binding protein
VTDALLVLVDTPVLVSWFRADDAAAVAVRDGHRDGLLTAYVLDLTLYDLGELLLDELRWPAARVADQLDDVLVVCGPPLTMSAKWRRDAAAIAAQHAVSFAAASLVASARALGATLLSTDDTLTGAGLAETPADFVPRHRDHIRNTP